MTFQPVEQIAAKDQAVWQLVAKANQAGTHRLQIEVASDALQKPVTASEPTNAYIAGKQETRSAQKPGTSDQRTR